MACFRASRQQIKKILAGIPILSTILLFFFCHKAFHVAEV